MSYDRTLATGSGVLRWRVAIDGLPYEFVSHADMETTAADGRVRYVGLRSEGIKFAEDVNLPAAEWKPQGMRIRIADVANRATEMFDKRPDLVTYFDATSVNNSSNSITVKSTTGWPESGYIYLDSETMSYASVDATHFLGCTRGVWSSLSQYHYGTIGSSVRYPEVTNWPMTFEGRRVRIHAYGSGDSPTGNGGNSSLPIWVGVMRTAPKYNGVEWSFNVDPLSTIFETDLGTDIDRPFGTRGIYYSAYAPLAIRFRELNGTGSGDTNATTEIAVSGFWESQEDFCADLTAHIQDCIVNHTTDGGTFTQTAVWAEPHGDQWAILYSTTGSPKWLVVQGPDWETVSPVSEVDGYFTRPWLDIASDEEVYDVEASKTYKKTLIAPEGLTGHATVPRSTLGYGRTFSFGSHTPTDNKLNMDYTVDVETKLYIDGAPTSGANGAEVVITANGAGIEETTFATVTLDTTNNAIAMAPHGGWDPRLARVMTSANVPEIRLGRDLGTGTLADMLTTLVAQTTQYLNTGTVPFIRPTDGGVLGDLDLSNSEIAAAADHNPLASGRSYTIFGERSLKELITHECRLLGVYPCYNGVGQIVFRRMRQPSPVEVGEHALTSSNILVDEQFFTKENSPHGLFNTVLLKTGYDPKEDEHTGDDFKVRDVSAFGQSPFGRVLQITPFSKDPRNVTWEDAVQVASPVLGVFGAPYAYVTVEVPFSFFNAQLGDVVSITWAKLPNNDGTIGVEDKLGLIVGRNWEPMSARGTLTIYLTEQRIGGYVPSFKIGTIDSGASGGTGPFAVTPASNYLPSGSDPTDFWAVGDKIRLVRWDSADTSTNVIGDVTAASATQLTFTTTTNWTHAGFATWALGAQVSTSITATGQKQFFYIADSDFLLDFSGDTDNAPFTLAAP